MAGSGSHALTQAEAQPGAQPGLCAVATAAHVVDHAFYWEQPIRLDQVETENSVLIRQEQQAIFSNATFDTAVIVFESGAIR